MSYNVEVGDCLLHAINEENNEAVEMLFFHLEQKKLEGTYDPEKTIVSNSFSPDITPIILAGHKVRLGVARSGGVEGFVAAEAFIQVASGRNT